MSIIFGNRKTATKAKMGRQSGTKTTSDESINRESFCGLYFGKGRVHTDYVGGKRHIHARKNNIIFCAKGKMFEEVLVKAPQKILNKYLPKE